MILRNLLLSGVCALGTTFALAQNQTFPFTLTTADGLPEQTSAAANAFTQWVSPTYTFDEPVSSFRLTVTHTSWQDAYNTSRSGGNGYIFFTMGEFYLFDAAGNQVELTADNFYGNATESPGTNDGVIGNLCDGDISTHYHTMYRNTEEPRPIAQEYYLEVTLPEPMTSFSFGFHKRSNNANIPSEIIVTKGGVDADPYPEFGFQLGEKVTTIEPGGLYVFADEGKITNEAWGENVGMTVYLATGKDPRYASPAGTDKYYRIRRTPNVDCIFEAVPAGESEFYLKSYLGGSYISAVNVTDGNVYINQAANVSSAAKFHLDENGYLVSNSHYYCIWGDETLTAWTSPSLVMSIFKASINNTFLLKDLTEKIAAAEKTLADNKEAFAGSDNGETAALEDAIADAKKVTESNTADEISMAKRQVDAAAINFMKLQMFLWIDYCQELLEEDNFGTTFGMYPMATKTSIMETQQALLADVDSRIFASLEDITAYLSEKKSVIDAWKIIDTYDTLPITLVAPDGQDQLGVQTDFSGYPDVSSNEKKYVYTSPTFVFEEAVDKLYFTFVHTNDGDNGGGYECTALANFAIYDENGVQIDLTGEDFECNAPEVGDNADNQPLDNLCDWNSDGTPNVNTYFHTRWSSSWRHSNEHWISVTLPKSLNSFSFSYITRGTGIAPKEIVVDTKPYHFIPETTAFIVKEVTSVDELDPSKYYLFYGNIYKVSDGADGNYYQGLNSKYYDGITKEGAFRLIPGETEGAYKIFFCVNNYYLTRPTSWTGGSTTTIEEEAGEYIFTESENLAGAFKVWAPPTEADEDNVKYMLQDWDGGMGYYKIAGEGFEADDTDGESDWTIYEIEPVEYKVYTTQVKKAAQLNTTDEFAMFGNLGKLNSQYGSPGGFYDGVTAIGETSTNFTLFHLEEGKDGTYKVHFIDKDVYLKAPTAWAGMALTEKAEEAGEFVFAESSNLPGAFKIYSTGTFILDSEKGTTLDGYCMLQDWGTSNGMGSYPIASFADDDPDGESDWYIFTPGNPLEVTIYREDYLGEYTYRYNDYWDSKAEDVVKEFDINLIADPESENGVIIESFRGQGPLKGTFDGVAHTISFPTGQVINDTNDDRWYGVVMIVGDDSYEKDIVFGIDLLYETIIAGGQIGIQYVDRTFFDTQGKSRDNDNGGWWMLSKSWTELVKKGGDDHVDRAVAGDAEVVSTSFFTVNGQAIAAPVQGINIIRTVLSDGTVKTTKVLIK